MSASTPEQSARRRGRIKFLFIASLFALPVTASYLLYFAFPDAIPRDTTNNGELVSPAQPSHDLGLLSEDGAPLVLDGEWHLVLLDDGRCDRDCGERLLMTRQLRLSLNTRMKRLQRVLVVPPGTDLPALHALLDAAHPDLKIVVDAQRDARRFFAGDEAAPQGAEPARALYMVDPLGNYLMRWPAGFDPKPLRKDIVRLLRASQIG